MLRVFLIVEHVPDVRTSSQLRGSRPLRIGESNSVLDAFDQLLLNLFGQVRAGPLVLEIFFFSLLLGFRVEGSTLLIGRHVEEAEGEDYFLSRRSVVLNKILRQGQAF